MSSIKGEDKPALLFDKRATSKSTSTSSTTGPANPRPGSTTTSLSRQPSNTVPDAVSAKPKQQQQLRPQQRTSPTKGVTTLIVLMVMVLVAGFSQILFSPLDPVKDDHWFDHQAWKVKQQQQQKQSVDEVKPPLVVKEQPKGEEEVHAIEKVVEASVEADKKDEPDVQIAAPDAPAPASSNITGNPIVKVLRAAGLTDIDPKDLEGLPSAETLTSLYGTLSEPVVVGMETCAAFRDKVPPDQRIASVAGMFNTGTNAMSFQLRNNVNIETTWQVPWGKHRMEFVRLNHTADGLHKVVKEHVLPVILIRDPLYWMQSMCKSPYAAHWNFKPDHCPNLVPNEADRHRFPDEVNSTSFHVKIIFDKNQVFYWQSLAHLWSDWYRRYVEADYPHLIFRFEDLLFHGPTIAKLIADCAGVTVPSVFKFQTGSAKSHGSHATFLDAIKKTGDLEKRLKHFTPDDLNYAAQHLDPDLMRIFRYTLPKVQ